MTFSFLIFIYSLATTLMLLLGVAVLIKDLNSESNRSFFFFTLSGASWLISLFFYFYESSPTIVLWLGRFNFAVVLFILYFLFSFSVVFPRRTVLIPRLLSLFISFATVVIFFITIGSSLVVQNEIIVGWFKRETVFGPLYFIYPIYYIFLVIGSVTLVFYKLRHISDRLERYQIYYFIGGWGIAMVFGFFTNIVLYGAGYTDASHYGVLAPVFVVVAGTFAIFKYRLFDIRLILAEVLIVVIAIILGAQPFFADTFAARLLNVFTLFLFAIFGYMLIKSVLREVRQKEQLAKLSSQLEDSNEQLKRLDETKSEFVSIASHQLRTPLTVIKGYISMLEEGSFGKIPVKQQPPLEKIFESSNRLIELVENLLSVSRIESGRMKYNFELTQFEELATSVVEEIKPSADKKKLKLTYVAPSAQLPKISIDAEKLRQVMMNLVDNAVKYSKEGWVKVETKFDNGKTNSNVTKPSVVFSVSDSGLGVHIEDQKRLFQKFIRGQGSALVHTQGTGLGLYVGRIMVEAHHGNIWVESPGEGKGSTFAFSIPLPPKTDQAVLALKDMLDYD